MPKEDSIPIPAEILKSEKPDELRAAIENLIAGFEIFAAVNKLDFFLIIRYDDKEDPDYSYGMCRAKFDKANMDSYLRVALLHDAAVTQLATAILTALQQIRRY